MIFGNNRYLYGSEIEPNYEYDGVIGCYEAMIDQTYNDQLLFEALIGADFLEVKSLKEGVEYDVLNEGTLGEIFKKVKSFLKTIFEKIMGIIANIEKKILKLLKKDIGSILKKYESDFTKNDTSDMKYKWKEYSDIGVEDKINGVTDKADEKLTAIGNATTSEQLKSYEEDKLSDNKLERSMLAAACGKTGDGQYTEPSDFDKDFEKHVVEEEKEETGLNAARKEEILKVLKGKEIETDLNEAKKKLKSQYDKLMKRVEDVEKQAIKDAKENIEKQQLAHIRGNVSTKVLTQMQNADNRIIAACVRLSKDKFNMCKSILIKGATYKNDDKKETHEESYLDALADAVYNDENFFA